MGLPRRRYVDDEKVGVYHCFTRCVRRAFLYGFDPVTKRDYCHRKAWVVERLQQLAAIFVIDVCAYSVMDNHHHTVLRTRPDLAAILSDHEVAARWLTLCPPRHRRKSKPAPSIEDHIGALARQPKRIAELRKRLSSLSWFMGRLNEFVARAANKEDEVTGRFWESRFKCQALLDEAAVAACMVYVDLNPIRAGIASIPEESDFASIQERIRAWAQENTATSSDARDIEPETWLCPIAQNSRNNGILQMSSIQYFDLVDRSGRVIRTDKRGAIDPGLAPILLRIGVNPEKWDQTISRFGSTFFLAAGTLSNMRGFAGQLGQRWIKGLTTARAAFSSPPTRAS